MSRMPIGISNETVVDRTILILTPLKSAARLIPQLSSPLNNPERGRSQQLKKFGSTAGRVLRGLAILHIRSALDWGRANRPDLPVRVESRVKSSPASAGSFSTGLHVGIADWFGLSREHQQAVVSKSMSRSAHYVDPLCRLSGSRIALDFTRPAVLSGPV